MTERLGQEKTKTKFGVLENTWSSDSYLENWRMPSFITVVGKLRSNPVYTQEPEKGIGSGDWRFFLK